MAGCGEERQAASKLEAEIAELRASGAPVDVPTLVQFHQQFSSREHTETWLHVLNEIESPFFVQAASGLPYLGDGAAVPLPGQPWIAQREVEMFLAAHQPLLERLHQLTQEPTAARQRGGAHQQYVGVAASAEAAVTSAHR